MDTRVSIAESRCDGVSVMAKTDLIVEFSLRVRRIGKLLASLSVGRFSLISVRQRQHHEPKLGDSHPHSPNLQSFLDGFARHMEARGRE